MDGNAPELIHCVVRATPPHEGASLHRLLAAHGCRLVVDGREAERRRALERRARSAQADERRRIRGNDGRRVTDRRAGAEPVTPPPELLVRAPALASADFARVRRLTPRERTDAEMTR